MADFTMPELSPGDMVLWYSDPFSPQDPAMGWISSKPGTQTVKILVWAEEAGFVEKPSVRHADDPFWRESETAASWGKWGSFREHPSTLMLKELKTLLTKAKVEAAKKKGPEA